MCGLWFLEIAEGRICIPLAPRPLLPLDNVWVMFHHSLNMQMSGEEEGRERPQRQLPPAGRVPL